MTELAIEVWSPSKESTLIIDSCRETRLLGAHLDISEEDTLHTDLLRRAEYTKLPRTPYDELMLISYGCRKPACRRMH